ncbi:MAG: cation transporter [Omnitrophica bacterium RIFCSPLOWO2_12_FULL_44_17]|uniref:Cation transporter n=1 Tax=Candidatus Danuiimicrobium aquiferis TaxID=1801832 RepID=A0A1G1KRR6_9BACT|nr:MAG: cation transporter [Omnitrophica bacterium RIFCSPHIGHO2_02_FULL_45_28]OGW92471.1 MAG: cation transporter [Omnitrophica bacterium RIFCSPHIGHO2_12_FULL_44_12]OGW95249.1 MAG: cation transporter [Omnitrophica bacterium RIFCSPLOWO2_12_FULL_44_17]OGX02344.1 MAG: cation transporter [Omnitrophica bacterium RIFCSPLOWO2_02_FULL_44_11]
MAHEEDAGQSHSLRKGGFVEKIIEFSAHNKFLIFIFTAVAIAVAIWSIKNIPLDAIPDLSDTQVIIYSRWDRSPDIIEDQVTYPIVSAMLGAPQVKAIRGFSDFGFSYVYVIFKDGTDLYWARSRTLEYLSKIIPRLPQGVQTELGPDATGVGWVFQYALVDKTGKHNLQELRSFQDWYLRYHLQSVSGVAEVASLGGFVKQYQITVDPNKLLAYNIPLTKVVEAIRNGNQETGGRLLEFSGAEYMVRGRGYAKSVKDFEDIVVSDDSKGTPVLVKHIGNVALGPDIRRGIAELDGQGDTVAGTVIMRSGENALNVINRVKAKIEELKPSFPPGVELVVTYDRSELIKHAIDTLKHQLMEEMIIVSLVILLFLWHFPSAVIPIVTIPISVLLSFIFLHGMKLTTNIMSLSGIAISIGVLVDGAIVEVENAYKRLEQWIEGGRKGDYHAIRLQALKEVGPAVFFSLLVIAVSFLPVFTLMDQEGRLFRPLAWAKTLAMAMAAILAVTLDPALRMLFTRMEPFKFKWPWFSKVASTLAVGTYYPEEKHPVSKILFKVYEPVCRFVLKHRKTTIITALILVLTTIPVYLRLGSEFMPSLWEGSLLYMPTTLPGISVTTAQKLLQEQDRILKTFPEVERVFGKSGRMESSTDPAPFSMMETVVVLKPQHEWRKKPRWYSKWVPEWLKWPLETIWPERLSHEELIAEMDKKLKISGTTNAWTMPIKNRIDMLTTGVRTPIGIKILGSDINEIEKLGTHLEMILKDIPGTRSIYAERVAGGYFLDFDIKREELARYGLSVADVQMVITAAIGGENITTTIEGRERYPVNVRYSREFRDDIEKLKRVLVPTMSGQHIPITELADIHVVSGPAMIRNENGLLAGYVYVDMSGRDIGTYVDEAKRIVAKELKLPSGYALLWSGQYENMIRVKERLKVVLPLTIFLICVLLYMNTKSAVKTGIVMLAVPFSLIGAVWFLWILGYQISIAVWVGMIALMGLDAETGVFMLLFLDLAYHDAVDKGKMKTEEDLEEAIIHGAVKRVRPKMMTVMAAFMGLIPIMWASGAGSDVMKRIAAPMIGGLFTSFTLELLIYPVVYYWWKWNYELKQGKEEVVL